MADFVAKLNNVRVTPRKAQLVADIVRGKSVGLALDELKLMKKKSAPLFSKLIHSAIANAQHKATVDVDRLFVSEVFVGKGITWKRFMPRAQGRAFPYQKHTSKIFLKVSER